MSDETIQIIPPKFVAQLCQTHSIVPPKCTIAVLHTVAEALVVQHQEHHHSMDTMEEKQSTIASNIQQDQEKGLLKAAKADNAAVLIGYQAKEVPLP